MTVSHASFRLSRFARGAVLATGATAAMLVSGCASAPRPEKLAEQARDAMHKGNNGRAIVLSEQAVRADGRNAGLRLMLANAYLRGGRFESARSAYADAIALGDDSSRAALGLALADLALGHNRAALDTLNTYSDVIPAADLGLALVMTGQNERGLTVLTTAVRNGKAGPKVRQNLAYGYALSGFWAEARVMAGQDIPANQVDARLESWAAMIRPEDGRRRVATMVGAPLVGDTGQPEALALAHFPAPAGARDRTCESHAGSGRCGRTGAGAAGTSRNRADTDGIGRARADRSARIASGCGLAGWGACHGPGRYDACTAPDRCPRRKDQGRCSHAGERPGHACRPDRRIQQR